MALDAQAAFLGEGFGQGADERDGILELIELDEGVFQALLQSVFTGRRHADEVEGHPASLGAGIDVRLLEEEIKGALHHGIARDEGLDLLVGQHPAGFPGNGCQAVAGGGLHPAWHPGFGAAGEGEGQTDQGHRGGDQSGCGASHGGSCWGYAVAQLAFTSCPYSCLRPSTGAPPAGGGCGGAAVARLRKAGPRCASRHPGAFSG